MGTADYTTAIHNTYRSRYGDNRLVISSVPTADLNTDRATADTVALMRQLAIQASVTPTLHQTARNIELLSASDQMDICRRVFWGLKGLMTFQNDMVIVGDKELLVSPEVMLQAENPVGDCDDYSMCVMALLAVMHIPSWFVTVAADSRMPEGFSHIYCAAQILTPTGELIRVPIDASHGKWFGWEVPEERITRIQEWR